MLNLASNMAKLIRKQYQSLLPFPPYSLFFHNNFWLLQGLSSVQLLSRAQLFATPWAAACLTSLSITNSQSLLKFTSSWWLHPTISSFVIPFSSCLQSFPASGSFPMSQFFASGHQNIRALASASVLPMNIQDWFSLGVTDLILHVY